MSVGLPDPDPVPEPPAEPASGWLSDVELSQARGRVPILYVEAIPVRVDDRGALTEIGLLLRASPLGELNRAIVSGRVQYGETVRDALLRHLEKDLGPMALPRLPMSLLPFQVAEYFPPPSPTGLTDERQHAVSLAYLVPVTGICEPRQDALEITWFSPADVLSPDVLDDLEGGRGSLLRTGLMHAGLNC